MALQSSPPLYVHGELYAGDWHLASYVQDTTEFPFSLKLPEKCSRYPSRYSAFLDVPS